MNKLSTPINRLLAGLMIIFFVTAPVPAWQGPKEAPEPALNSVEKSAEASVKTDTIKEMTVALTGQDFQGRGTATPGGEKAARFIADRFAKLGLKPLGDQGSYLQSVKFRASSIAPDSSLKLGEKRLKLKEDFLIAPLYFGDKAEVTANLVFAGFGVVSEELKRNDLAGLDLKGKIAIVVRGKPKNVDEAVWQRATSPNAVFRNLSEQGIAGIIFINTDAVKQNFAAIASFLDKRKVELTDSPLPSFKLPPILFLKEDKAEQIFEGTQTTFKDLVTKIESGEVASKDLAKPATISLALKVEDAVGSNVVAMLEGSDATLKDQAVVYSAHYDAFGMNAQGQIFPGAADNALGVGMLTAIAEALAKMPERPRRSVIFMAVTGEEYGLLGAEYWLRNPTWPIAKLAANINFDGIGTEVYGPVKQVCGFGKEFSELGKIMTEVVTAMGNRVLDDPFPEEKVFYRSDHFAFVKRGVPGIMMLGGPDIELAKLKERARSWLQTHYHQQTDTVNADWNWDGPRTLAATGLLVGLRVANQEAMPAWSPGVPYKR